MLRNIKKITRKIIRLSGYDIQKIHPLPFHETNEQLPLAAGLTGIQYACGPKLLKDWVNVDSYPVEIMKNRFGMTPAYVYYQTDLRRRQPFPDNSFGYAFAEDFIEHLSQGDSITLSQRMLTGPQTRRGAQVELSRPGGGIETTFFNRGVQRTPQRNT